ncbi:MAG TPA: ABC transporter permease [Gemmatimonadaceae bacterium]
MWNPLHFAQRRRRSDADFSEEIAALLRRAARRLVRAPVFALTAVLTLALGIGATTAVFSLVDGVLLRPLPFAHPAQLVDLSHTIQLTGVSHIDQSDATYLYYKRANHVFASVGAYRVAAVNVSATGAAAGDQARAERIDAARASASVFATLGVAPLEGRVFRDDEDLPGARPVVILSERLWKTHYASDPHILGRTLLIDGVPHDVVGIMPARFTFPDDDTQLWLPIGIDPAATRSAAFDFRAVARLRPGATARMAAAELDKLLPQVPVAFPGRLTVNAIAVTHMHPVVRALRDTMVGSVSRTLWVVFGAAAFLLLIACANVANLFLVRAEARQHDLTVRRALGAGRAAIVAEFFSEALVLAVLGGVVGVALASAVLGALRAMPSGVAIPRLDGVGIDGAVLAVAAGVTLLTALVMSVVPALRSYGAQVATVLGQTTRGATAGRSRHRARRAFVVVQMALALVLVTGAGLMARTFQSLRSVMPGFDAERAYTFRVALPPATYPTPSATVAFVTHALDELSAIPGVQAAGVITKLPLDAEARYDTAVFVEDKPLAKGQMPNIHQVAYASPDALRALGVPIIAGHTFEQPDPSRARLEVVVTHALAKRYWPAGDAVGRRLRLAPKGPLFTVVGVTGDIRGTGLDEPPDETVFLPLVTAPGDAKADGGVSDARFAPRLLAFVVQSASATHDVTVPVERTLRAIAPDVPVYAVRSMREVLARSTARTSFTMALLEIASLAALLIGAVGLYGVVSYMVSLRARDMAVRIALGAQPASLRRQVLTQAVAVAAVGIAIGLAASVVVTRFLAALLFGVTPDDPVTLAGAVALMTIVAVAASWFPARRAAEVDPAVVLRAE